MIARFCRIVEGDYGSMPGSEGLRDLALPGALAGVGDALCGLLLIVLRSNGDSHRLKARLANGELLREHSTDTLPQLLERGNSFRLSARHNRATSPRIRRPTNASTGKVLANCSQFWLVVLPLAGLLTVPLNAACHSLKGPFICNGFTHLA